jgi:HEAT repeat protein
MMSAMTWPISAIPRHFQKIAAFTLLAAAGFLPSTTWGQLNYVARFEMEKPAYSLGEPIFCKFVIHNTGNQVFAFLYRSPTRIVSKDHDQEPNFLVTSSGGGKLRDPAPVPCGGTQGTVVYGSVTLPPGQTHTERWLLNQWAEFESPGRYRARAERRLALAEADPATGKTSEKPAAFALALDELSFRVDPSSPAERTAAFEPYLAAIRNLKEPNPAEAVMVVTTMPQPAFLEPLVNMVNAPKPDRWDRRDALNGLARLGTAAAWEAILKIACDGESPAHPGSKDSAAGGTARSYALLLIEEKADPQFLPALVEMFQKSQEPRRGEILRGLGFFHDARASQTLFDNLHSAQVADRMNAILGLKTLGTRDVIPALLAMLNDPEAQVRQIANFALEGLTRHKVNPSAGPSPQEPAHTAELWHAWWREHGASFAPPRPAPCHDW